MSAESTIRLTKEDIDFGKTAQDYAKHRAGFPDNFFEQIKKLNLVKKETQVLDLGTGVGTVARGLAKMGAKVTAVDPSPDLMTEAQKLDEKAGVQIRYLIGKAEKIKLLDQTFDLVTAGQCWHWFEQDLVLKEIKRVLKPQGRLLIAYFDWIAQPENPVDVMYKLRAKYNPSWKSSWPLGFYPEKPGDLKLDGYISEKSFIYDENVAYDHKSWRGRMRAYAAIGGSLSAQKVEEFDQEFKKVLKEKFPQEPMMIPHKVWAEIWRLDN